MIRLAHRVRVRQDCFRIWRATCPACETHLPVSVSFRVALWRAQLHATNCPNLRRLNRPVTLRRPS